MKRPPSAGNKEGYYSYQEADQNGVVVVNLELLHLLLTYIQAAKRHDRYQNKSAGIRGGRGRPNYQILLKSKVCPTEFNRIKINQIWIFYLIK